MRTIAGELGYGTGEGVRAEASWQHRNFFNPEGALTRARRWRARRSSLARSRSGATISCGATRCSTRRRWPATSTATPSRRRPLSLSAGIERQSNFIWQKKWTWSLGAELVATDERDTIEATGEPRRRTFFIAALPASLGYDGSDDLLDPTKGFRLLGRLSPEISFQGGTFAYARAQFDAQRLPSGVGQRRRGRADPARHDPRRRARRHRAVAALLFGRRRVGARLWLSAARAARRRRRSDRRAQPGRIRLEARDPAEGVRRQFRDRAVPRRRHAVDRRDARLQATGSSARASACAIIRASGRSGSTSARRSIRRRATAASRWSSASARPSDGRERVAAPAKAAASGSSLAPRHWRRRLVNELLVLLLVLLALAGRRAGPARHGARASLHRRPHRARSRPRPACDPRRPDRRLDLRRVAG